MFILLSAHSYKEVSSNIRQRREANFNAKLVQNYKNTL